MAQYEYLFVTNILANHSELIHHACAEKTLQMQYVKQDLVDLVFA